MDRYWPGASQETETESLGKFHYNEFGFNCAQHAPGLDKLISLKLQMLILLWNQDIYQSINLNTLDSSLNLSSFPPLWWHKAKREHKFLLLCIHEN